MLRYTLLDKALGRGLVNDTVLRIGSRVGVRTRIRKEARGGVAAQEARLRAL
ncbi:MAG: hypothetical protein QOF76_1457, partial [Solirubrobacteraceae bacterium]|nr:hypothetical protein [Solirubrobacteraceae bacterium]